ncbi:MAG: hypothetical protein K5920_09695 [Bacteroidales bacterium]|nr:hypothetical protein [Bacteroidales bacterium]
MENNNENTVNEPELTFKMITDRVSLRISNPDIEEPLCELSGYDLRVRFNFAYIKSLEDVEIASAAIGNLFKNMILEELLGKNKTENA